MRLFLALCAIVVMCFTSCRAGMEIGKVQMMLTQDYDPHKK